MNHFYLQLSILELSDTVPLLCWQCLEDLKICYKFYERLKIASSHLRNYYQELSDQCNNGEVISEDCIQAEANELHLGLESIEENAEIPQDKTDSSDKKELLLPMPKNKSHIREISTNSSFVVTQYFPTKIQSLETSASDCEDASLKRNLLTIDCKAIEIKDVNELQRLDSSSMVDCKETLIQAPPALAIYMCQYCPQAFAKLEFLKTHIQKSHVCKFCTEPFSLAAELYRHIREVHTEHRCVICHKVFSSNTNLRQHIRRVHRINLPPKIALLDFVQANAEEDDGIIDANSLVCDKYFTGQQFDTNVYNSPDDIVE